jgi:putative endonuclease
MTGDSSVTRAARGRRSYRAGVDAEALACQALVRDGWTVLEQRIRTGAGEIDIAALRDGLLALIEVKHRPDLASAAWCLSTRQRARLLAAGEALLAARPDWIWHAMRFDVMLVDATGTIRRIADAFRLE